MNRTRTLALTLAGLALLLAGCSTATHSAPRVHLDGSHPAVVVTGCPTEDSCTAQYAHGQWTIRRTTP